MQRSGKVRARPASLPDVAATKASSRRRSLPLGHGRRRLANRHSATNMVQSGINSCGGPHQAGDPAPYGPDPTTPANHTPAIHARLFAPAQPPRRPQGVNSGRLRAGVRRMFTD